MLLTKCHLPISIHQSIHSSMGSAPVGVHSGVNHGGGTGRYCPLQSFNLLDSSIDVPPKFKLRRDTAGSCFVRSHKQYITYYNFESAIVKLQFPICILTSGGSRGDPGPSLNHLKNYNIYSLQHSPRPLVAKDFLPLAIGASRL